MPFCHPHLLSAQEPPRRALLRGPPGCSKTILAKAIVVTPTGRVAPCLLFIDEIDAITPKRESGKREINEMEHSRIIPKKQNKLAIVISATDQPDPSDAALLRAGLFNYKICIQSNTQLLLRIRDNIIRSFDLFQDRSNVVDNWLLRNVAESLTVEYSAASLRIRSLAHLEATVCLKSERRVLACALEKLSHRSKIFKVLSDGGK
ncbi:hypothetical protein F4604DRAFT_1686103 [Suillus subluteus]|nr:hypothetical protein F4604DRAFT_1686103 [Suillus subluteus]